jgi:hypothetical protein
LFTFGFVAAHWVAGTAARVDIEWGMVDLMRLWRLGTRVKDLGGGSGNVGEIRRLIVDTDLCTVARYVLL